MTEAQRQEFAHVVGQLIIRTARDSCGNDLGLIGPAILGALSSVIAAAEHPEAMLDAALMVLEKSRPTILAMHDKIYAAVELARSVADKPGSQLS